MEPRRIVIVDDHPLLATGLQVELTRSGADVVLLDPTIGADRLVDDIASRRPDCAVVDLGLPFPGGGSGLIAPLVSKGVRVAVLTATTDRQPLARSSSDGAQVVLSKSEPLAEVVDAIIRVADGQAVRPGQRDELALELDRMTAERSLRHARFADLTPRERQVLAGLMDGTAASALAERHYVSMATIRAQIRSVLAKLGVGSQLEAVALAHRSQWSPEEDQS